MTITNWDLDTNKKIIAEHLQQYHAVDFRSRASLNDEEFKEEHFPKLLRYLQDEKNGYLSADGRKEISSIDSKIREALKFCEESQIPVVRVCDFNESGNIEWRICKPTSEQVEYLKFKRWFVIIEGLANKTLLQGNLVDEISLDEILKEMKNAIIEKQNKRQEIRIKNLKKEVNNESQKSS